MKVYWGITASRSYTNTIPARESVIISAAGLWKGNRFQRKRLIWPDWALDSGGFTALNRWGDYPFSPDEYLALVRDRNPVWAASMDYPCEPDINRRGELQSNADRIEATVEKARYLCKRDSRIVPVLQGYTAEEFIYCYYRLRHYMNVSRVAIGSVCRRQSTPEIESLCAELRPVLRDCQMVHGFGVKLRALSHPHVQALFTSIDTNAWEFWKRYHDEGQGMSDAEAWERYAAKVADVLAQPRQLALDV